MSLIIRNYRMHFTWHRDPVSVWCEIVDNDIFDETSVTCIFEIMQPSRIVM